jgi:fructose-specific phosphotransferase system component IIB
MGQHKKPLTEMFKSNALKELKKIEHPLQSMPKNILPSKAIDPTKITQSIIANEVALDFMRNIVGTKYYRQSVKNAVNLANKELQKASEKDFDMFFEAGENQSKAADDLFNAMHSMTKEISSLGITHFMVITDMIKAYKKDPASISGIVNKINR